jgi:hypothetical protein
MVKENRTILIFLAIMILALSVTFIFSQVDTSYIVNKNISTVIVGSNITQDVAIQDYTGEAFSFFLTMPLQYTTLTQNININDSVIIVDDSTNCNIFDAIDIYNNYSYTQTLIKNVVGNTITLNSELDRNFNISDTIIKCGEWDLSTSDGSVTTQTFMITPPMSQKWHIYSTAINILDNAVMDSAKFGGGPALINGISGRVTDGYTKDLFLIYNNNGFFLRGFDLNYIEKAPSGVYGLNARLRFNDEYGAVVDLDGATSDEWQAVNRDDLTGQSEIAITISGHYVND